MATVNLLGALALDDTAAATRDAVLDLTGAHDTPALAAQPGIATLAVRRDADSIPTADGDLSMLAVDEEGRLKTSGKTASFPVVTGALTTVAQTVTADVSRASNVVFHVKNTGAATMSVGTFVFEASIDSTNGVDGTWFSIRAVRSNANTIDNQSGTLGLVAGAGLTYSWAASVNAYQWMRVRCTVIPTATSIKHRNVDYPARLLRDRAHPRRPGQRDPARQWDRHGRPHVRLRLRPHDRRDHQRRDRPQCHRLALRHHSEQSHHDRRLPQAVLEGDRAHSRDRRPAHHPAHPRWHHADAQPRRDRPALRTRHRPRRHRRHGRNRHHRQCRRCADRSHLRVAHHEHTRGRMLVMCPITTTPPPTRQTL